MNVLPDPARRGIAGIVLRLAPAACCWLTGPAWAQATPAQPETIDQTIAVGSSETAPKAEEPRKSQSRLVEEIVVTAQKREEAIQDVPISISAFSADQLDARGLVSVRDLSLATPGLQFTDLAGYTLIYLRGIGTDAFIPSADPSVATYIDGIYFPSSHSMAQSFGALERIEVLKGPQGTLFGRNSTGGAISVVTKKPSTSTAETSIQASYGRFDDLKTRVYSNLPLTDSLALSISGIYNHAEPYYTLDNPSHQTLLPDVGKGARLKLRWLPTDNLDFTLTGMSLQQSGAGTALSVTTHPSPLARALLVPTETREYVATDDSFPSLVTSTTAVYGEGDWHLGGLDIKLLSSYYKVRAHEFQYDFDASARPLVTFSTDNEFQKIKTAELQFISTPETWGSDWLKWVSGLYYLESKGGYDPAFLSLANSVVTLPTGQLVQLVPQGLLDLLPPLPTPSKVGLYFHGLLGTKSYSGFAQATATLNDWLDLTLGGRYQRETRELLVSNVEIDNSQGGRSTLIPFAPRSSTVGNFSPKLTLDFKPGDDILVYLSYSQGFKSATYNIVNIYLPPDYVKPEKVTAYELGLKSTLLDGQLRFNAAVFQNVIDDLQTSFVSLLSGGAINFQNAGQARIRGAEFDSTWVLMPVRDPGLVLTAGASYLDAIYTDFKGGNGFDETTGLYFNNRDFSGNRIARTPKFTGTLGLSQTIETGWNGPIEIAADFYYNSGYYYLPQNSPVSFEDAYTVINARISYLYQPWQLRVTLYGSNLGDTRYDLAQFHTDFGRADTLAPPLGYGLRVNWDF